MKNEVFAVEVNNLRKSFRVPHEKVGSLKGHATRLFKKVPVTNHEVLRNVSFNVYPGEFFSIIGANGSGKSTLLKILAGIYEPTKGSVKHNGSMSTLIELGVGFNFELSGRDNIFLNAALFGITKKEVQKVYDKIVRFAEIGEFIDQKIKNYSSGMQVRLAFAIAIQARADIIIVDEVLAVGDANFQQKCFDVFRELKANGKTIIFVSHDLQVVKDFSDRVLLLHNGKQEGVFKPLEAIDAYQKLNATEMERADFEQSPAPEVVIEKEEEKINKNLPHIEDVKFLDESGNLTRLIKRGTNCTVVVQINNPTKEVVHAGVSIVRNDGVYCYGTNTHVENVNLPANEKITIEYKIDKIQLQKGAYYIVAGVFSKDYRTVYEMRLKAKFFRISQDDSTDGIVRLEHSWKVE